MIFHAVMLVELASPPILDVGCPWILFNAIVLVKLQRGQTHLLKWLPYRNINLYQFVLFDASEIRCQSVLFVIRMLKS